MCARFKLLKDVHVAATPGRIGWRGSGIISVTVYFIRPEPHPATALARERIK
jgi:hypothetical protein